MRALLDRLLETRDLRALGRIKLAAIGPGTAEELARYHLRADVVPHEFRAESLAESLLEPAAAGSRFLLARASRGREVLAETLSDHGGQVDQVVVYHSRDVAHSEPEIAHLLGEGKIDWITVTSSAIVPDRTNQNIPRARLAEATEEYCPGATSTRSVLYFRCASGSPHLKQ